MPTTRVRPDPIIPDHEVLRRIGGGAYGEVWLARGVTGALRAVKVVWREDFDDERSFEREFEGILKYEPISRDHPALVNVLHVGRSPDPQEFYYYVMELGDDVVGGCDINPVEYEARTLRSDIKRAEGKRLETGFCIDVGQRLADALRHLHELNLAHRDMKPANVIFVNGRAKLADIGLVAARDQRTFVGTEGFVPPEGPGSTEADVYSLGKVLYEAATGRDRLDFPELPDDLPSGAERKQWLALNQIICDTCEPHVSRRQIRTAAELSEALANLRAGKRRRRRRQRRPARAFVLSMLLGGALAWGVWEYANNGGRWQEWVERFETRTPPAPPPEPEAETAFLKISSTPDGADVIDVSDDAGTVRLIGQTPIGPLRYTVGEEISLRIVRDGYRLYEETRTIPASAAMEPLVISAELELFAPPVVDEPWSDHLGEEYRPLGEGHESVERIDETCWQAYEVTTGAPHPSQIVTVDHRGEPRRLVVTSEDEAVKFCEWLVARCLDEGYLTEGYEAVPRFPEKFAHPRLNERARTDQWRPFKVLVRPIPYGQVTVETRPPGAEIYVDGENRGSSGLLIDKVPPGILELTASLEGYKSETRRVEVGPRGTRRLEIQLEENKSVVLDRPWTNSLGMKFVPAGESWMASIWETRRKDFAAFARVEDGAMPPPPDWLTNPGDDHPVVSVSREEAEAFCEWLTEKERAEDRLKPSLEYRLPTDLEWSHLAGLEENAESSPASRDLFKPRVFFWGTTWPPPNHVANLADTGSASPRSRQVPDYEDGYPITAPVGSYKANELGVHDLCGNAQEWVADAYSSTVSEGLLRGGGWRSYQESDLYIGARNPQPPDAVDTSYGFRVVLAKIALDSGEESDLNSGSDGDD